MSAPTDERNVTRKRKALADVGKDPAAGSANFAFPNDEWEDTLWRSSDVSFPAIYRHFMENSLARASSSQLADADGDGGAMCDSDLFSSFKGIDKGYKFLRLEMF